MATGTALAAEALETATAIALQNNGQPSAGFPPLPDIVFLMIGLAFAVVAVGTGVALFFVWRARR